MASSRASSPSSPGSLGAFDLSPAAKVRALLAQVDSDSDQDSIPRPARKKTSAETAISNGAARAAAASSSGGEEEEEGDDDEDIIRPRGRLAAAMRAGTKPAGEPDLAAEGDARERVRRMLQLSEAKEKSTQDAPAQATEMGDVDAEDELPTRKRRLQNRPRRSATPDAATPPKEKSPGLFVSPYGPDSPARRSEAGNASGSDLDLPSIKNNRFKELLAKKRKERQAREAEEARKKEARAAAMRDLAPEADEDDVSDITDDEGGRRLTQGGAPRPSRKASRKALEEMNRETQRMARSLQLAHQAKTKKKISKSALFERFNFKPAGTAAQAEPKLASSSRPTSPVSAQHTDTDMKDVDTPPSSPPALAQDVLGRDKAAAAEQVRLGAAQTALDMTLEEGPREDLANLQDASPKLGKTPDKAAPAPPGASRSSKQAAPKRHIRVKLPEIQANNALIELDDELVIVPTKKSKLDAIFDRVPANKAKEPRSMQALRRLAHIGSPEKQAIKKVDKSAMTTGELLAQLQQRARQQSKLERDRRLEMLRAKGVHVQTAEEREREMAEVEDIVTRARREAEEIMEREREAAKREKREARAADPLAWDDSDDDDDYTEDTEVPAEIELSGSEEEADGEEPEPDAGPEEEEEQSTPKAKTGTAALLDQEADSAESESEQDWEDPDAEEERHRWGDSDDGMDQDESESETEVVRAKAKKPRRQKQLVLSDDDEELVEATPRPKNPFARSPAARGTPSEAPTSVLRSATKTFIPGLPVAGPAGLSLTQIFAGTMDDSQPAPATGSPQEFMPSFDNFPASQLSQDTPVRGNGRATDSQPPATQEAATQERESQGVQISFSQSQAHGFDSLLQASATQTSEMIELTQDAGFQNFTPLKQRFVDAPASALDTAAPHRTQPTQPFEEEEHHHESPLVRKKGRLRRKMEARPGSGSEDDGRDGRDGMDLEEDEDEFGFGTVTAFNVMKEAAAREKRKAREEFSKKSKAKDMVEDQAEESEDEYAGLGGVDGEDSDDDDAASVHEMIDDNTQGNEVEDGKLAAFYADRARADDEKQVDKLFRDITSGMLRRKRGADYDLSDSDDGGEARRRMKRRQFAKMQKALFADERISKVAENPRNQAFLRTIEDRGSDDDDDDMDLVLEAAAAGPAPRPSGDGAGAGASDEPGRPERVVIPDSQPRHHPGEARGPPLASGPAANARRRAAAATDRKPASLGEIRASLSNLLEEPSGNTVIPGTDPGSDSDEGGGGGGGGGGSGGEEGPAPRGSDKENARPRRRGRRAAVEVVDRMALKRNASSTSSSAGSSTTTSGGGGGGGGGRLAFAAPASSSSSGGFKVPALLRRATTNSLMNGGGGGGAGSSSTGVTTSNGLSAAAAASSSGFGEEGKIKKGAGRRSGINYFARESERRAAVAESEKRREARKWKGAEGRVKVVGGLFGAGKFE